MKETFVGIFTKNYDDKIDMTPWKTVRVLIAA